ncbi:MAG TPA: dihydroneopterin aldolase [Lichenihabitans sp.]|nr:dihydroneopterin aldolase [Lichenihabitans sp.]
MNPFRSTDGPLEGADNDARIIVIEDLDLDLRIGVFEAEKRAPQRVRISVEVLVKPAKPRHEDRIERVVSYAAIHDGIAALAERPHIALQETLADDVARICLEAEEAVAARVYVRKLDVYADCRSVGIRIVRTKGG